MRESRIVIRCAPDCGAAECEIVMGAGGWNDLNLTLVWANN